MSPCSPDDINLTEPDGPSLPAIPGFGQPFAPKLPTFPFPSNFPEDLNELFNTLSMILPPGTLKPSLNPNFGKDVFDAIMNLLDKFFPFLMLYKFFLPILNLIICIIEVLCALMNPFKLIRALKRLFRNCIPEFLSLFPIFALIVMLLSLLFLLLALIEYIILQILRIIQMLLRNIRAVVKAIQKADAGSLAAITKKLGILLCCFQNIFVILAIFAVIIQVIKDILKLLFKIPPCDDSDNSDTENCCTPEVCPAFIRNNEDFTRQTGAFQYYPTVSAGGGVLPPPFDTLLTVSKRTQSYQLFDSQAPQELQLINIVDAFDITNSPKPVFFPTEVTYTSATPPSQAPYKVNVRVFYNPTDWGRSAPITNTVINVSGGGVVGTTTTFTNGTDVLIPNFVNQNPVFFQVVNTSTNKVVAAANDGVLTANGRSATLVSATTDFGSIAGLTNYKFVILDPAPVSNRGGFTINSGTGTSVTFTKPPYDPATANGRFVRFNDCIVLNPPTTNYLGYDNTNTIIPQGVVFLGGGLGTEDNGAVLLGFESDGHTQKSSQATLESFLFMPPTIGTDPPLLPTDGKRFDNIEYKFIINHEVLLGKALITLGCIPTVALDRTFVNTIFGSNSGLNFALLNNLINGPGFPDVAGAQECLQNALDALRLDMSETGVAQFQATTDVCLNKLKKDTYSGINGLIGIGYDQYKSTFTLTPPIQFTSKKIKIKVQLQENNGISISDNLPETVASDMETRLKATITFGIIGPFKYDGSSFFEADITSDVAGDGTVSIAFDNKAISTVFISSDIDVAPTVDVTKLPHAFIFTPTSKIGDTTILTGVGDTDGAPRRDEGDLSRSPDGDGGTG